MSGYRRVNYYELCRLCTSSEGIKMHIFREEGRRRQLSSKIQLCLPLQVCEDDSLPKIICNHCVERLESFFDFRNSCVNAEAMLESYFSSLRYSEEFIREGKVYVKDESPQKKKGQTEAEKAATVKVPNVQTVTSIPVSMEGLNSLTSIQIVSPPEDQVTRLPQYKCTMEMQPSSVSVSSGLADATVPALRYTYQTVSNMADTHTTTANIGVSTLSPQQQQVKTIPQHIPQHQPTMDQGTTTYYVRVPTSMEQGTSPGPNVDSEVSVLDGGTLHPITFTPGGHGQDMLLHFGYKENKDQNNATTILRTDDRASIAQIGEFLRMKTVVVESDPNPVESAVDSSEQASPSCEQCGKQLNTPELQANHALSCSDPASDEKHGGPFSCETCGKVFKRKEHLFQHRKLHTGERPYVCVTCGKSFSRKEHLVRHSVSHTGQKVHNCNMCSKSFSRKDNLHKHRKTHGIAGPYICEICGKSFVVKHYYLMHKASHEPTDSPDEPLPYRCDICFKGFSVKSYLTTHKLRHRGKSAAMVVDSTSGDPEGDDEDTEQGERDDTDPLTLSTVNAAAILPPNVIHHGNNQVFHVANTTYMTTTSSNHLIDNYRRMNTS